MASPASPLLIVLAVIVAVGGVEDHDSGGPPDYGIMGTAEYLLKEAGRMLEYTQLTGWSQEEMANLMWDIADGVGCFGKCGPIITAYRTGQKIIPQAGMCY